MLVVKRTFIHSMFIDFNAFFASVEQELHPELRGRPVVVVPLLAETTCCIAASREARPFGIKTGTPVHEARRLCPGVRVVESHPEDYIRVHQQLKRVVRGCGVYPEVCSSDEPGAARALAGRVKEAIRQHIGARLTCSVGLAPNRFLAKTASDMQKPDGLVTILPADLPQILHPLALRDLSGIGPRMEARLRAHSIETVEHLCAASRTLLHKIWGSVEGKLFHDALHGAPTVARAEARRSLGHSHILPPELRTVESARSVLHRLTQKAAMRLRACECVTERVNIFVRHVGPVEDWGDEIGCNPTQDTVELLRTLDALWSRRPALPGVTPFAVGVNFLDLQEEANSSLPLFDAEGVRRRRALLSAVDRLNVQEGKNTVYFAGAHGAVGYSPMRIAFTRIPDPETER